MDFRRNRTYSKSDESVLHITPRGSRAIDSMAQHRVPLSHLVDKGSPSQCATSLKDIPETCRVIRRVYQEDIVKCPLTEAEWHAVVSRFADRWNFSHCIFAINGKHLCMDSKSGVGILQLQEVFQHTTLSHSRCRLKISVSRCRS